MQPVQIPIASMPLLDQYTIHLLLTTDLSILERWLCTLALDRSRPRNHASPAWVPGPHTGLVRQR
jgi:hypothetical protein